MVKFPLIKDFHLAAALGEQLLEDFLRVAGDSCFFRII
jgi:hypothetical protein